ncbi:MAG: RecX family transcriptional regulator [Bacteroidetes bacterium]|nr:RecX family transcriptional regulator [Bacteroidota bacterium]
MNDAALNKLRHYCAYQERCHEEVRTKLLSLKIYGEGLEAIINKLIEDDFLNEERFAKAYAGGKFRMKKWGRGKIVQGLKLRKISDYCIKKAMLEIDESDYQKTLAALVKAALKKYDAKSFRNKK